MKPRKSELSPDADGNEIEKMLNWKSASYKSWLDWVLYVQKQGCRYWFIISFGKTNLLIWKLQYPAYENVQWKKRFLKNQWRHFLKRLICTVKSVALADVYEKSEELKKQVSLQFAISPHVYEVVEPLRASTAQSVPVRILRCIFPAILYSVRRRILSREW